MSDEQTPLEAYGPPKDKPWTPTESETKVITIRVSPAVYAKLVAETHRRQMRMSELLRSYIAQELDPPVNAVDPVPMGDWSPGAHKEYTRPPEPPDIGATTT
jgi:hypothetical protein